MPSMDGAVATHPLAIEPEQRPMKQARRHMKPDLATEVEAKVDKLVTIEFIWEA